MKTYGKKILAALLTLVLIITLVPNMAYAADTTSSTEADNNDTPANATPLSTAGAVTGILSSDDDVDFYQYTVDVSGYCTFDFKNLAIDGANWYITIYDSELNELESGHRGGYTYTSNTYDFKKGTVLYYKVEYYSNGGATNKEYSIMVNASEDPSWEQEYNDTKGTATMIYSNKTAYGNLYADYDVDFYQYTVDASGYCTFDFKNLATDGANWYITIYDSEFNALESGYRGAYTYTSNTYDFKKGTVLYYKVEYYSNGGATRKGYSITVNAKKSTSWEQEKNDSYSKAIALKVNKTKYGNIYKLDDVDFYSYTATKTGSLKTTFKFDADNVGNGWQVTIYDSLKNVIKDVTYITTDKTISFKATKGKKYYIVVRTDSYSSPIGITYALKIK